MIRQLRCRTCLPERGFFTKNELRKGWDRRQLFLSCTMPNAKCDLCAKPITGQIVVAVTQWNGRTERSPGYWEEEFGTVVDGRTVEVTDTLTK